MTTDTALIADDEPLLREVLQGLLAVQWPELRLVAQARNGVEAIEQFEALRPAVCFLDIHMPGLSGIQVAQRIGGRAHVVFVTAFDLKSDEKYTLVAWRGGIGKQGEAFIRTPLKVLIEQLDPAQFQQIHRSVVVNLNAISHVTRGDNETADVFFKHRSEALPVSRTYLHLFKAE